MRAILLANATAANFGGLRLRRATIRGAPRPPRRTCWMTAVAPTTNTLRKASSPALVMTPSLTLPAVLRRQADPGRELPPRSKHLGCRSFHQQQSRADRTDAGDIGEAPAAFVGLVPGHELGVSFGDLRLQLR